jgi:uncharacterized protein YjaZ
MGVLKTDEWLKKYLNSPLLICSKLKKLFNEDSPQRVYQYLSRNGMYKYSSRSEYDFKLLMKNRGFFSSKGKKSGLAFKDKMFLFYTPGLSEKELEAVFVHEYHHVCRLNFLKKDINQFTLMDSIILEGLAEHAVLSYVGERHLADWTRFYSAKEIKRIGNTLIKPHLELKKNEELHDQILYGLGRYPRMIGYAAGFHAVSHMKEKHLVTDRATFNKPSETFLEGFFED